MVRAPRILRGALGMHPVVHAWSYGRQKSCKLRSFEITDCALTRAFCGADGI
jgi:hypothetical protein